jgi:uncharacterized membrane protein YbhN (UPF0104 family)
LEPPLRHKILRAVQAVLLAAVVIFAGVKLVDQWGQVRQAALQLSPQWSYVIASCLIVLVAYAILVDVWRALLTGLSTRLRFWDAARIWTISNLGKYIPGKVWQLGAMAVMARQEGASGIAAGSSAIVANLTSVLTGFAVVAITGAGVTRIPVAAEVALWIGGAVLLVLPLALPRLAPLVARVLRRPVTVPRISPSVLIRVIIGSGLAWCAYGIAFRLLARGLLGDVPGSVALYIGIFTASYLFGYIMIFSPGGIFFREMAMQVALQNAGFSTGSATVLVVASRLWLTVLEILPAVVFLIVRPVRLSSPTATPGRAPADE